MVETHALQATYDISTRFQVAMEVSTLVHVGKTLENLKTPVSDFTFREQFLPVLHKLV